VTEVGTPVIDEATVREMFGRFNDREAFFADNEGTWIDRPRYRIYAQDREMNTRAEVVAWFRAFFESFPDLSVEVEDVIVSGETGRERAVVRWILRGTFTGEPYMGVAAPGCPIELRGMDLLDFEGDRIAGNSVYFDQLSFARQIGMLPPEGSVRDRLITRGFNAVAHLRRRIRRRT